MIEELRGVVDDVILTAGGPCADQLRGDTKNTRVLRAIATALGLASRSKQVDRGGGERARTGTEAG